MALVRTEESRMTARGYQPKVHDTSTIVSGEGTFTQIRKKKVSTRLSYLTWQLPGSFTTNDTFL